MSVNDYKVAPTTDVFEVHYGPTPSSATFIFGNEDHTLGNTLRYILMENADTDFCGYSVPHPYVPKMNVRLQTRNQGSTPLNSLTLLKTGLSDMATVCDTLDAVFVNSLAEFKKSAKSKKAK
jgi:DNA-directed RNA polymerases I and III subunit RPAC2